MDISILEKGTKVLNKKTGLVEVADGKGRLVPTGLTKAAIDSMTPMARVGRGMLDVGQGIKQGYKYLEDSITGGDEFDKYTSEVDKDINLYERGRTAKGQDGMDWMRLGGQAAATLPLGLMGGGATTIGQVGKGMLQGGLAGASLYNKEGNMGEKALNTSFGLAGGAVAPFVAKGVGVGASKLAQGTRSMYRNLKPKNMDQVNVIIKNRFAQDGIDFENMPLVDKKLLLKSAKDQLNATGSLDADALVRKARAESLGFTGDRAPTVSQVTRSPQAWTRERNLAKVEDVGEDLTRKYKQQNTRFSELGDEIAETTGGISDDIADTNESIIKAINSKWKSTQKEVGKLYNGIEKKYGDTPISEDSSLTLLSKIDELTDDATTGNIPTSVLNRLKRFGVIDNEMNPTGSITVKQAESLRKFIGKLADGGDPNLLRVKRELIGSIDETVIDSFGDDAFSSARKAAATRFNDFESKVGNVMKKITKETLSEDDAFSSVIRAKSEELQAIKSNMLGENIADTTGEGRAAWANIQKQTIKNIWDKANNVKQNGETAFSGNRFGKELDKIGRKKLRVLFGEERTKRLYDIAKTGADLTIEPPWSSVNYSNTTPTLMNLLGDLKIPYLSRGVNKGAQQIESNMYMIGSPVNKGVDLGNVDAGVAKFITNPMMRTGAAPMGLLTDETQGNLRGSLLK